MSRRDPICPDCRVSVDTRGNGDHLGNCPSGPLYAPGQESTRTETAGPSEPRFYASRGGCWNMDPHTPHGECPGKASS